MYFNFIHNPWMLTRRILIGMLFYPTMSFRHDTLECTG